MTSNGHRAHEERVKKNLVAFLQRVELRGREVPALQEALAWIHGAHNADYDLPKLVLAPPPPPENETTAEGIPPDVDQSEDVAGGS